MTAAQLGICYVPFTTMASFKDQLRLIFNLNTPLKFVYLPFNNSVYKANLEIVF